MPQRLLVFFVGDIGPMFGGHAFWHIAREARHDRGRDLLGLTPWSGRFYGVLIAARRCHSAHYRLPARSTQMLNTIPTW